MKTTNTLRNDVNTIAYMNSEPTSKNVLNMATRSLYVFCSTFGVPVLQELHYPNSFLYFYIRYNPLQFTVFIQPFAEISVLHLGAEISEHAEMRCSDESEVD